MIKENVVDSSNIIKIAAAQMDVAFQKPSINLKKILKLTRTASDNESQLIVFPECALTGYCFESREEAFLFAETIPGPSTEQVQKLCQELGIYAIYGLIEKEESMLFNALAFVGPNGLIGKHRKLHLPHLALDHFVDPGDLPITVFQTPIGNIGMGICYDLKFPEYSRMLALKGADLIVLPTNWPDPGRPIMDPHLARARAIENKVFFLACNRVGGERDYTFPGQSVIFDTRGNDLAQGNEREETIYASIDLHEARQKVIQRRPGFWMNYLEDRRPELYGDLIKKK